MYRIIIILLFLSFQTGYSQEMSGIFLIKKIKKLKNDSYMITAVSNSKTYKILSFYDKNLSGKDAIKKNLHYFLKIRAVCPTEKVSTKDLMAMMEGNRFTFNDTEFSKEDSVEIFPTVFHWPSVQKVHYHGNIISIKPEEYALYYYACNLNGIFYTAYSME